MAVKEEVVNVQGLGHVATWDMAVAACISPVTPGKNSKSVYKISNGLLKS
jgi:hypothetical protein